MVFFNHVFASHQLELFISSFNNYDVCEIQFIHFENGSLKTLDKVKIEKPNENILFQNKLGNQTGLYFIVVNNSKYIEVLLNENEKPLIKGNLNDFIQGNVSIVNSTENEAYYSFQSILLSYQKMESIYYSRLDSLSYLNPKYLSSYKENELWLFNQQKEVNKKLKEIKDKYNNIYTVNILIPLALFPEPSNEEFKNYETNRSFLSDNYFRGINSIDNSITSHYLFADKLKYYIDNFFDPNITYNSSISKLYALTKNQPELRSFVFNSFFQYILKLENTKYLDNLKEAFFIEKLDTLNFLLKSDYKALNLSKNSLKGGLLPNFKLSNLNGETFVLDEIVQKNKITMVVVFSSSCSTCEEVIPKLKEIVAKYSGLGLGVFAINLEVYNEYVYNENWVEVVDTLNLVQNQCFIQEIPTLFLVDSQKKILAKNIFGDALEKWLKVNL